MAVDAETPAEYAEALARIKLRYNESLLGQIRADDWEGIPFCFDALLAAGTEAVLPADAVAKAIVVHQTLATCPQCGAQTGHANGARVCGSCDWHEAIVQPHTERARACVDLSRGATMLTLLTSCSRSRAGCPSRH